MTSLDLHRLLPALLLQSLNLQLLRLDLLLLRLDLLLEGLHGLLHGLPHLRGLQRGSPWRRCSRCGGLTMLRKRRRRSGAGPQRRRSQRLARLPL